MEGYLPRPEYPAQVPWTDLSTGEAKFALSGDPVGGSGGLMEFSCLQEIEGLLWLAVPLQ